MSRLLSEDAVIHSLIDYTRGKKTIWQCIEDTPTAEPNQWIPCSERMPEVHGGIRQNLWVTVKKNDSIRWCCEMMYDYDGFHHMNGRKVTDEYVIIAWQKEIRPKTYYGDMEEADFK